MFKVLSNTINYRTFKLFSQADKNVVYSKNNIKYYNTLVSRSYSTLILKSLGMILFPFSIQSFTTTTSMKLLQLLVLSK